LVFAFSLFFFKGKNFFSCMDETRVEHASHVVGCRPDCYCNLTIDWVHHVDKMYLETLRDHMCMTMAKRVWERIEDKTQWNRKLYKEQETWASLMKILVGHGVRLSIHKVHRLRIRNPSLAYALVSSGAIHNPFKTDQGDTQLHYEIHMAFPPEAGNPLERLWLDTMHVLLSTLQHVPAVLIAIIVDYALESLDTIRKWRDHSRHRSGTGSTLSSTLTHEHGSPMAPTEVYSYTRRVSRWNRIDACIAKLRNTSLAQCPLVSPPPPPQSLHTLEAPGCKKCLTSWQDQYLSTMPCAWTVGSVVWFACSRALSRYPRNKMSTATYVFQEGPPFDAWHQGTHYVLRGPMELTIDPAALKVDGNYALAHGKTWVTDEDDEEQKRDDPSIPSKTDEWEWGFVKDGDSDDSPGVDTERLCPGEAKRKALETDGFDLSLGLDSVHRSPPPDPELQRAIALSLRTVPEPGSSDLDTDFAMKQALALSLLEY
jgi:hypothetical protein